MTTKKELETKPQNVTNYEKAIALGKQLTESGNITKAEVARQIHELICDEDRQVIVTAFIEGANLTEKGAMTYFYNIRKKSVIKK